MASIANIDEIANILLLHLLECRNIIYALGKTQKTQTICEAIKIPTKNMEALVRKKDFTEGTLKKFEVLARHIKHYLSF